MAVVEVVQLHKRYGEKVAVEDVSFTVDQGEIFGIPGPNGAGEDHHGRMRRGTAHAGRGRDEAVLSPAVAGSWARCGRRRARSRAGGSSRCSA